MESTLPHSLLEYRPANIRYDADVVVALAVSDQWNLRLKVTTPYYTLMAFYTWTGSRCRCCIAWFKPSICVLTHTHTHTLTWLCFKISNAQILRVSDMYYRILVYYPSYMLSFFHYNSISFQVWGTLKHFTGVHSITAICLGSPVYWSVCHNRIYNIRRCQRTKPKVRLKVSNDMSS